ncbi:MAG: ATP synthase F1 subunit gamma [Candidatus Kapaibacteriales bacterium]
MATLRDIKRRIAAVASTAKITQAMRMVASAKLKRAQDAIHYARPYSNRLKSNLEYLIASVGETYSHPLLEQREKIQNICFILITSDRGLCGSLNTNLIRFAKNYIEKEIHTIMPLSTLSMIRIGKRGISGFKSNIVNIIEDISGISGKIDYKTIKNISDFVINGYIHKKFDQIYFFYNEFKNVLTQIPKVFKLLPFETAQIPITPDTKQFQTNYIFEPDAQSLLNNLLPRYIENQILRLMLESNAAEHAARRLAMENATNNAKDLIKHLELVYNKERQASITKEMLDIIGGANALRSA